jgi:hypothetical protein
VRKVSSEKDQVLVELTQAEMAVLVEGQAVVLEVGKERFIVSGTLAKINVVKQSALIELDEADDRLAPKQRVGFASIFANVGASPILTSVAQYHQYTRSFAEGYAGVFGGQATETASTPSGKVESKTSLFGYLLGTEGHLVIYPHGFGFGLEYERRSASADSTSTASSEAGETESKGKAETTVNLLKPAMWFETSPGLRYGLGYEYEAMDRSYDSDGAKPRFNYSVGRLAASLVGYSDTSEWGFEYRDKARQEQSDTLVQEDGTQQATRQVYASPAEIAAFYRSASSPTFVWGLRGSYLVVDRRGAKDEPLDRRPEIPEHLKLRVTFEHRLSDGDKLDWLLFYEGAQSPDLTLAPRGVNAAGFGLSYQKPAGVGWTAGGTFLAEGGTLKVEDDRAAEYGGETITTESTAVAGSLIVFVRREFEGETRRKR